MFDKRIQIIGPVVIWGLMFVVAGSIRVIAFDDAMSFIQLPADASLWASGVLLTMAVSEDTYFGPRWRRRVEQMRDGYAVRYRVVPPTNPGFMPLYVYLFGISLAMWLLTLVLTSSALAELKDASAVTAIALAQTALAVFLASVIVSMAILALRRGLS